MSDSRQIELLQEQVDAIVIQELKESIEMNLSYKRSNRDYDLILAMLRTLNYFMHDYEFMTYRASLDL